MVLFRWLIYIFLLLVVVTFTVVNNHFITLSFFPLPYEVDMPLYALILALFLLGALVGNILTYGDRISLRGNIRKKDKTIVELREKIDLLQRQLPEKSLIEEKS